ncbi:DNA polymerase III, gamma subunit, domain III, partial [Dillenia turbinata]
MTRVVRDRVLKEKNGDISDHLRNHIHLTNCIHLKNHMHRHSPILADRSLMRDIMVLQRSRSLRDPSMSPPSWHSPSVADLLAKKVDEEPIIRSGRRSLGNDRRRDSRRLSGTSPILVGIGTSKVAPSYDSRGNNEISATSQHSGKSRARDGRGSKRDEPSMDSRGTDGVGSNEEPAARDEVGFVFGASGVKEKKSRQKGKQNEDAQMKTLSERLKEVPIDSDGVASSNIQQRYTRYQRAAEEPETSIHGYCSGLNKAKRRKFRGPRRTRAATASRDAGIQSEQSVASNSLAQSSGRPKYHMDNGEGGYNDQNVTRAPRNGCGIPWNWSRIHDRGKTFFNMAGRSFSCGLSDSRLRRGGPVPEGKDIYDMPVASERASSSTRSDAEALPLLVEASGSQESTENAAWVPDYSGELGIFADHLLKHEKDSDLASEARSGDQPQFRRYCTVRHQNLTQKYMPRTFRDLVGQHLVVQALSNAVMKRKVGLLYVFHGPHGTGKTSCARIFARALNCQSLEHPKPCGRCNSCIAHDMGKNRNIREVGPVSNFDFENILDILDNMVVSQMPLHYRVFIFDDCDTLSPDCWRAISKVVDRAPRRVVFVLVSSSLDVLPHIIISRCQKFFFPKLKDSDIIYTLQWIATKEDIEIDKEALKLLASRSDGSLRDAKMTLEQLSLLGQKISVPLVQELVGLVCDEKLVDLLDLALSADTVNTVKNLREIMETGVEPLALMSQLATVTTDILAGTYDFTKEKSTRKFFRRQTLSKEEMEKLRLALKTLSEAEKQLRMSNDKLTWLTAALLQLAPDQQYMLPSSADTSFNQTPMAHTSTGGRAIIKKDNAEHTYMPTERGLSANVKIENTHTGSNHDAYGSTMMRGSGTVRETNVNRVNGRKTAANGSLQIDEIWSEVLDNIQIKSLKDFLSQEGKLISVSLGAAPTVQLMFSSYLTKSRAEKFRGHILQAFEFVLGSPITIEIRCDSRKEARAGSYVPLSLTASENGASQIATVPRGGYEDANKRASKDREANGVGTTQAQMLHSNSRDIVRSEIVEIAASPREPTCNGQGDVTQSGQRVPESAWKAEASSSQKRAATSLLERRKLGEQNPSQSIVKSKVSLAHVIQQAEGCQRSGWSKRKAVSIAEKLEQENLRLEPRSRSLLCWKATRTTRGKLSRLKIRARRPQSLLKLVPCGKLLGDGRISSLVFEYE